MGGIRRAWLVASVLGVSLSACTLVTGLDALTICGAACDAADATLEGAAPSGEASVVDTASPSIDAGVDSADAGDAGKDAAIADSSVPDALTYLCPGAAPVTDCATCATGNFPCVLCGSAGGDVTQLRGVCVTSASSGSACQGKGPPGFDDCLCPGPAASSVCPEPYQVCVPQSGPACRTCGFPGGAGLACKGGGVCSVSGLCK